MSERAVDPDWFITTYASSVFRHRDELWDVLSRRTFTSFYGGPEEDTGHNKSRCSHYSDIYHFRHERMVERLQDSPERRDLCDDILHLLTRIDRTPEESCSLYLCFTDSHQFCMFVRPTVGDIAGCFKHPHHKAQ